MVGVEVRRDRWMIRMAVGKADDLQASRLGVFLHAELFQGVERVAIPGAIGDGIAHTSEFRHLVIAGVDAADECAAGFVGVTGLEVLPHPVNDGPRDP